MTSARTRWSSFLFCIATALVALAATCPVRAASAMSQDEKMKWFREAKFGLFIHLFTWPAGSFELPPIKEKVTKAYLLADPHKKALAVRQDGQQWSISLPATAPDETDSVLVLETAAP